MTHSIASPPKLNQGEMPTADRPHESRTGLSRGLGARSLDQEPSSTEKQSVPCVQSAPLDVSVHELNDLTAAFDLLEQSA